MNVSYLWKPYWVTLLNPDLMSMISDKSVKILLFAIISQMLDYTWNNLKSFKLWEYKEESGLNAKKMSILCCLEIG